MQIFPDLETGNGRSSISETAHTHRIKSFFTIVLFKIGADNMYKNKLLKMHLMVQSQAWADPEGGGGHGEHSAIRLTLIKLPFVIKNFNCFVYF